MFDQVVDSCQFLLNNYPEAKCALEYLDSRLSKESQDLFQFGFFPNINNIKVLTNIIGEDVLKNSNLFRTKDIEDSQYPRAVHYSHFDDHPLILPFKDPYGKIVALVGRSLLSDEEMKKNGISKYKNTKDFKKGNYLFGLYENKKHIIENDLIYLVEGQFDLIKAIECGFRNVVALGTSSMTPYQFSVISRYTSNIILLLDNDEAGKKGRNIIMSKFGQFANIQNLYIPKPYKDIDEYLSKEKITTFQDMEFVLSI